MRVKEKGLAWRSNREVKRFPESGGGARVGSQAKHVSLFLIYSLMHSFIHSTLGAREVPSPVGDIL